MKHFAKMSVALSAAAAALLMAGCGTGIEPASSVSTVTVPTSASPKTRFDLANGCYALQSLGSGKFVVRTASGYAATAASASVAESFYMKPTALGEYLLHGKDQNMLSASGTTVVALARATPAANWILASSDQGAYTLTSETATQALNAAADGQLSLGGAGAGTAKFAFVPAAACKAYPEISTDSVGNTFKGRGVNQPVVGFAEVHAHLAMGHEMSDGAPKNLRGPSAGGAMYGQMFHRFGVPHALEDCAAWHGPNGTRDPEAAVLDMTPGKTHNTKGWPTFVDWPAHNSQLHQASYYKWIERAYKAGMRILVSEGTNIEALCDVAKIYMSTVRPQEAQGYECRDMAVGMQQARYLLDMEKYIDAQEGGPGKGWFRIVRSPTEARAVINDGKLAVVAGLEFSNVFFCNVTFNPDGSETSACDKAKIDQQIEEAWNLGVREVFPYHDVNSSLGGTGIFNGDVLNLVGFYGTRGFWQTEDCPDGGEGEKYFYSAGAKMYNSGFPAGFGGDPLTAALISATQGRLPTYKTGVRQCNKRGMTTLGEYAMQKLMDKGFIIDIDHASMKAKNKMLELANARTPKYPLISAHGGHGGISVVQARNILANKGLIYPSQQNGLSYVNFMKALDPIWKAERGSEQIAVGFGTDVNGLANRPTPRGAGRPELRYPFTLFQGADWNDPMFAGIAPITFGQQTIPESGKKWEADVDGTGAHYGMLADSVEEIRLEGGTAALKAFYQSAEAYIQMWEQTVNR